MRTTNDASRDGPAPGTLQIELRGLTKSFGGLVANDQVGFRVATGEILGLVGENGAGKSTCMNMLFGHVVPDSGTILVNGREVRFRSPREAIAAGIGMVHQHFLLAPALTALEHLELVAGRGIRELAIARMKELGFELDLDAAVADLAVGQQQQLEILKVICQGARVIILDEPTAVLTPVEVRPFLDCLRRLRDSGHAIILISHKLDEVIQVCGRIVVMRAGKVVGESSGQVSVDFLSGAMIGEDVTRDHDGGGVHDGNAAPVVVPVLEMIDYRMDGIRDALDVSLTVRGREIVGVAGVEGNGQEALFRAILGISGPRGPGGVSGTIRISGVDVTGLSSRALRRKVRVGVLPFDRRAEGLLLDEDPANNLLLSGVNPDNSGWMVDHAALLGRARGYFDKYAISPAGWTGPLRSLSGGNQQKFVVARELEQEPALLLAAHPTRGVDWRASGNIHAAIKGARDRGAGVLVVSSDLDELCKVSDRIVVMLRGQIVREFHRDSRGGRSEFDVAGIGLAMTGGGAP